MVIELIKWWYGSGWLRAFYKAVVWTQAVKDWFSIPVLARTLFSPWKQIVTLPGNSLDARFRAAVDNLVSRIVGFFVRITVLIASFVLYGLAAAAGLITAIIWPFIPFLVIYFVVRSITG